MVPLHTRVSWRLVASGPTVARDTSATLNETPAKAKTTRKAYFNGAAVETPVYQRRELALDQAIKGPAIIEERETTIIILPGWTAKVHATGCIMAAKE